MLTKVKLSVLAQVVKIYLKKLRDSNDTKTTFLGLLAAAIVERNLDLEKLFTGDIEQLGNLAFALTVFLLAYFTNKEKK